MENSEEVDPFVGIVQMTPAGVVPEDEQKRLFEAILANRRVRELWEHWHEGYLEAEKRIVTNIKNQRVRAGMSQEQVAQQLRGYRFDFHQSTVAKVEAGKRPLRLAELFAFADVLDTPWTALLEGGRDIDILPSQGMLPIDAWEAGLEDLIFKRQDVLDEITQEIEEKARRYAEWDRMILIRISALANAAAQAERNGELKNTKRIDALVDKWTDRASSRALSRAKWEESVEERERTAAGFEREHEERRRKEEAMWLEFKEWRASRPVDPFKDDS